MTAVYRCDGPDCESIMGKDDARLELLVQEPPHVPEEGEYPVLELAFGFEGDHHFCGPTCLATWAMRRHLDNLPDGTEPPGDTAP